MTTTIDLTLDEAPLVSDKSLFRYNHTYDTFTSWQKSNGFTSFTEDVLLEYFTESAKTYKPSTLWCTYSMLRSTIARNNNIDISEYRRLIGFLREKSAAVEKTKAKVFSTDEVNRFLAEAPDADYLLMKVLMVFGVAGGSKGDELTHLKVDYVKDYGTEIIVKIPSTNESNPKVFLIGGEFAKIVQKYVRLRPADVTTDRFFLQYHKGLVRNIPIGIKTISNVPRDIAKFLKLDDSQMYTTRSFRPTNFPQIVVETAKREVKRRGIAHSGDASLGSKRPATSANINSNVAKTIVKPELPTSVPVSDVPRSRTLKTIAKSQPPITLLVSDAPHQTLNENTNLSKQDDRMSSERIMPMLPLTIGHMKRSPYFYTGLEPERFSRLLELARENNQLNDLKIMLALRKRRLNEHFEVLADLFDLDKKTTERYYHESKHTVIDLVDFLPTALPTSRHVAPKSNYVETPKSNYVEIKSSQIEPMIKIKVCDNSNLSDPIAVEPIFEIQNAFL